MVKCVEIFTIAIDNLSCKGGDALVPGLFYEQMKMVWHYAVADDFNQWTTSSVMHEIVSLFTTIKGEFMALFTLIKLDEINQARVFSVIIKNRFLFGGTVVNMIDFTRREN